MAGQAYVDQVLNSRRRVRRRSSLSDQVREVREGVWSIAVKALERFSGYRRGLGNRDFHLAAEVRDLVARTGRHTRDDMEALIASVMRAGSYTRDEAGRAVRAVVAALSERVPSDLLTRLSEYLRPEDRAAFRAAAERLAARRAARDQGQD